MLNIGFTEFVAIGVIALLVIGPKQLPEVARVVGRLMGELKRATQDLSGGLLEVTRDVRESIHDTTQQLMNEGNQIVDAIRHSEPDEIQETPKEEIVELEYPNEDKEKIDEQS